MPALPLKELRTIEEVRKAGQRLRRTIIIGVDLTRLTIEHWRRAKIGETFFLGCLFRDSIAERLLKGKGAVLLPRFQRLAYNPYRLALYTPHELLLKRRGRHTLDQSIYEEFTIKGKFPPHVVEAVTRGMHDDSIDDDLGRLLKEKGENKIVGIMGGSSARRDDPWYRKTAQTARLLAQAGYFVMTGGGPGMMEAGNLGAYLCRADPSALDDAIRILSEAPDHQHPDYLKNAIIVKGRFKESATDSLGIPTWFYGFEPTNVFSTYIAKYFANSRREAGILQVARAGVVFAPGSAGTRQEIFMDAAQNHYGTTGMYSPMTFLGLKQYQVDAPIYPLLQRVSNDKYKDLLFISDDPAQLVDFIKAHPPRPA